MEFFNEGKIVRLQSHLGKYLIADRNEESVCQSRSENCTESRWMVEFVEGKSHVIRLISCHGSYLSTSDEPFLLGMTGKKVVQTFPTKRLDVHSVEWEPIRDGDHVKLRTKGGKFLRANGAMPPWRNSITYDVPHRTATQDWVLWDVKVIDISLTDSSESLPTYLSSESSLSSLQDDFADFDSPSRATQYFETAKAIRLQSHHGKFLVADDDEKSVRQSRNGSSHKARWTVELGKGKNSNTVRLTSCHGLYLTGIDEPFLLGMTGKKVIQAADGNGSGFDQWEPIKESSMHFIKLRSKDGNFLRANRGMPPYRNSVTYDVPHRTLTQDWVLWSVDVVDINLSSLTLAMMIIPVHQTLDHPHFSPVDFDALLENSTERRPIRRQNQTEG
jgi:hypothetical protein